ncbi:MAG: hypothetical protein Q8R61_02440 [Thiobacillus sp.]|uniref:hypothetical protein n=1 Tax=Thiobacillus sp. TaxID=924 RepID=UPI002733A8FA|nr:hypothetical protein [Thiobacillus sp.]MDP3583958.1 hypothetical protein [Thiobacillus sp.]
MNLSECLTLLALIMALSAYIGSVRARLLDRAKESTTEKCDYIRDVARLMWIDVPLVVSGLLLLLFVMMWQLGNYRADVVLAAALSVFALSAVVMAIFHACEWCKSLGKLNECKTKS